MGLLSSLGKVAKGAVNLVAGGVINFVKNPSLKTAPAAALDVATTVIPVGKVVKPAAIGVKAAAPVVTKTAPKIISAVVKGVTSVAKAVIPKTTKGKVIAAVAAPVVLGAVTSQPKETAKAIASTPSSLFNVGSNTANLIANPSVENAKTLFTENPLIVGGAAAVGAIALGKSILPAVATTRQTAAINEQTEALQNLSPQVISVTDKSADFKPIENTSFAPSSPVTPQTQSINKTGLPTKRRKKKAQIPSIIKQNVSVNVMNRSSSTGIRTTNKNKNYINRELYN